MRIITKRAIVQSWLKYPDAKQSLAIWEERVYHSDFKNHQDLKKIFKDADYVPNKNFKHLTIFNIKGNSYRLIVDIFFNTGHVFVKWFGPHTAYDKVNVHSLPNRGFVLC